MAGEPHLNQQREPGGLWMRPDTPPAEPVLVLYQDPSTTPSTQKKKTPPRCRPQPKKKKKGESTKRHRRSTRARSHTKRKEKAGRARPTPPPGRGPLASSAADRVSARTNATQHRRPRHGQPASSTSAWKHGVTPADPTHAARGHARVPRPAPAAPPPSTGQRSATARSPRRLAQGAPPPPPTAFAQWCARPRRAQ